MSAEPEVGLLRRVVRLLPVRQMVWGEAMQAELMGITGARARWGFVLGCARAVVSQPAGALRACWLLLRLAVVVGVLAVGLVMVDAIRVASTRWEAMAAVSVLIAVYGLMRSRFGCGPVSGNRLVQGVAAVGAGIVVVQILLTFRQLRVDPPLMLPSDTTVGVPDSGRAATQIAALAVGLAIYLIALARVTARRSGVDAGAVAIGGGVAASCVALWLALVLLWPSAASASGPALVAVLGGGLAAALVVAIRGRSGPGALAERAALVAGLLAAVGAAFGVGVLMNVLPLTGAWVSSSGPPSYLTVPPIRVVDTVVVYLPGVAMALALALVLRRPRTVAIVRPEVRT